VKYRDLTAEELALCDRAILAGRLEAIQRERAELLARLDAAEAAPPVWQDVEGERYGKCLKCGRLARWWDDPLAARWVHVQPWAVTGPAAHPAEVAS
jgi:hypothetical protein